MWSFLRKSRSGGSEPSKAEIKRCSFCSKTEHEVRKLIAGRTVYICEECIELCNDILAEEFREEPKIETKVPAHTEPAPSVLLPSVPLQGCLLCRLPKEAEEMTYIPDRGAICSVCLDTIQAVVDESNERQKTT